MINIKKEIKVKSATYIMTIIYSWIKLQNIKGKIVKYFKILKIMTIIFLRYKILILIIKNMTIVLFYKFNQSKKSEKLIIFQIIS